jgi:hypothetical protein
MSSGRALGLTAVHVCVLPPESNSKSGRALMLVVVNLCTLTPEINQKR